MVGLLCKTILCGVWKGGGDGGSACCFEKREVAQWTKSGVCRPLKPHNARFENPRVSRSIRGQGGDAPLWGVGQSPTKTTDCVELFVEGGDLVELFFGDDGDVGIGCGVADDE